MSDTQTPETKTPETKTPETKAEAAKRVSKPTKGKVVRLIAVHGDICHYADGTRFSTDDSVKHEFDDWCEVQLEAGKLRVDNGEE